MDWFEQVKIEKSLNLVALNPFFHIISLKSGYSQESGSITKMGETFSFFLRHIWTIVDEKSTYTYCVLPWLQQLLRTVNHFDEDLKNLCVCATIYTSFFRCYSTFNVRLMNLSRNCHFPFVNITFFSIKSRLSRIPMLKNTIRVSVPFQNV